MNRHFLKLYIPTEWDEILMRIRRRFPTAVIAGGCLRDLDFDRNIKDVDIFIDSNPQDEFDQITKVVSGGDLNVSVPIHKREFSNIPEYMMDEDDVEELHKKIDESNAEYELKLNEFKQKHGSRLIYAIYNAEYKGWKFEIIFGNDTACDPFLFDLSFCQIYYDGNQIMKSSHYLETEESKVVKLTNITKLNGNLDRVERFRDKYNDFVFDMSITA